MSWSRQRAVGSRQWRGGKRCVAILLAIALAGVAQAKTPASDLEIVARDPAGHGLLCRSQGKTVLFVAGSPCEMGAAQGRLTAAKIRTLVEHVVYVVGAGQTFRSGKWFFDEMADIERRCGPYIPPRFLDECDALSDAAGVSRRDGRCANLFPELFHCSGIAVRGKATRDGRVLHARVLDYMRDIRLQDGATVTLFMPQGRHAWMSLGYAGFVGTVTAMNEKGLAIGEMGGRGEGHWDGVPMSLLLRDVMERAATVEEGLALMREARRTCEYYYVLSDKSRAMAAVECTPEKFKVMQPGEQDPRLPHIPADTVLVSGPDRAKVLAERVEKAFGQIDAPTLIEIIKRPVAMQSNLHDAIFSAETLEMWCADAGRHTPACDEPYARFQLDELLRFYRAESAGARPAK